MVLDVKVEEQYCMILSRFRVYQGLALYYSLKKRLNVFRIFILCMDNEALQFTKLMFGEDAIPISVELLEDDQLCFLRQNRELDEYCWTLKPVFIEYILKDYKDISRITYLDADLFFYAEPNRIFEGIEKYSVLLSSHDFSSQYKSLEKSCGTYNSGLISFNNDSEGRACIEWWKNRCYDLCSKQFRNNQFGDQKYLEQMPLKYKDVSVIKVLGANIAPWNHSKYSFRNHKGSVYINNERLICYHFSGFRLASEKEFSLSFGYERKPIPILYKPYLLMINQALADYKEKRAAHDACFIEGNRKNSACVYKIKMYSNSV